MWTLALALGLGCGGPPEPPALPREQQVQVVLGPLAHAWRDRARAERNPGLAAVQYRALAATLEGLTLSTPELVDWRDLLVVAAERGTALRRVLPHGSDSTP